MNLDVSEASAVASAASEVTHQSTTLSAQTTVSDEREATELNPVHGLPDQSTSQPFHTPANHAQGSKSPPTSESRYCLQSIRSFWKHYIQLAVPHGTCRDHLANERTFLAYQRTSLALSMIGVVTAQLFNLQRLTSTHATLGYFALGKPLAALFQITAMIVTIIGAHRFWRQQMNMSRGKVWAGGWEIYVIMVAILLLVMLVFTLLIAADISKEF